MKYIIMISIFFFSFFLSITSSYGIEAVCTMELKMCDDGKTYVGREGPNCEFKACPGENNSEAGREGCIDDYAPACGQKSVQCIQAPCKSILTTYSNKCYLESDTADFLYYGECREAEAEEDDRVMCTEEAKICPDGKTYVSRGGPNCEFAACPNSKEINCTQDFAPVCGEPVCRGSNCHLMGKPVPQTFTNKCKLMKSDAVYLYKGECGSHQNEGSMIGLKQMNPSIQVKLDSIISQLNTIINKYEGTQKKMLILKVKFKIDAIKHKKPNFGIWLDYISDNL